MKKRVLITGAGRGIGQTIAVTLTGLGFEVSGCARSQKELQETKDLTKGAMHTTPVDVTDEQDLRKWILTEMAKPGAEPWGLVTAAGIYGPIGSFVDNSWDDWKKGIEINLYGTALACQIFAGELIRLKKQGSIVLLSGGGATQPLPQFSNYCAAKAAVVRFGETLAQELKPHGITVNAVAPGAVNTKLTEELLQAGPEKAGRDMYEKALKQKESGGTSPQKGSDLAAYLLSHEARQITGRLISAVWDPWGTMHENAEEIMRTDIYTLRRIVPEDRKNRP
ncbi:MAG: SDR family oxidoreductase [Oligoflexia bacterium]|nr:SDR family oxidoreductase [Oligoflexia bacterium]